MKKFMVAALIAGLMGACAGESDTSCYTKDFGDGMETICGSVGGEYDGCMGGVDAQGREWADCPE